MPDNSLLIAKDSPGSRTTRRKDRRGRAGQRLVTTASVAALAMGAMLTFGRPVWSQAFPPYDPRHACSDANCAPVIGVTPDFDINTPHFAYSPELAKFVDPLPSIPVATPAASPVVGEANVDYYEIAVRDFTQKMHRDLPATHLRGYAQANGVPTVNGVATPTQKYLGPLIVARKNRPVRIKLKNELTAPFQIPVDETIMGAGYGPPVHSATGVTCSLAELAVPGNDCIYGKYSKNRAELHLHGGFLPWISDGTPHQWVTPVGDASIYKKGLSFQNVPDMAGGATPNDATATYYYPNEQSGRLMFYHDHSLGITRLNVYAGEAAGYVVTDAQEDGLTAAAGVFPGVGVGTPLVIQDKTFVNPTTIAAKDPTWLTGGFGSNPGTAVLGDLWFPHVYIPNQYPVGGMNPLGRWDYGPWVSPPTMVFNNKIPTTSITPEAFMDTMVVNGAVYPYMEVGRKPVRLRLLNASNDRMLNLQLYYATTGTGTFGPAPTHTPAPGVKCNSAAYPASQCTEVKMIPADGALIKNVPHKYMAPNGLRDVNVPFDLRAGGVPDPTRQGPPFIQIGSEGGLLPKPVVHYMRAVDMERDPKSMTVNNIRNQPVNAPPGCPTCNYPYNGYSLFLGPAERADVIVDFTDVPDGSTLILYNDAPAANPARDARFDLYTGNTDLTATGGPTATKKGFGPNTRTVMQFRVNARKMGIAPANAINRNTNWVQVDTDGQFATPASLVGAALASAYTASHTADAANPSETSSLLPTCDPNNLATCGDTRLCTFAKPCLTGRTEFPSCQGYTPDRALQLALGTATDAGGNVIDPNTIPQKMRSTLNAAGTALTTQATENFGLPHFRDNTPQGCGYPVYTKSIAEDFDPVYGRMNSKLGTETPALDPAGQQTFGFYYNDPTTEALDENETQIWNVVHNGVDTHAVHFHLFNVQVINRVDWGGVVKPADANELGWKETVLMNPLENVVMAVKANKPVLPWPLPLSNRPRDVTLAIGAGNPNGQTLFPFTFGGTTTNQFEDYQWEYVWHCHLLGHEENDMMRPFAFVPAGNVYTPPNFITP